MEEQTGTIGETERQQVWDKYVKFVAQIVIDHKLIPTPIYKEIFREAVLTKFAEIELLEATDKDIEISQEIIDKVKETI